MSAESNNGAYKEGREGVQRGTVQKDEVEQTLKDRIKRFTAV